MSFKHLSTDGHTEVHCDGASHLAITKPDHVHSGVPLVIEEVDCDCAKDVEKSSPPSFRANLRQKLAS